MSVEERTVQLTVDKFSAPQTDGVGLAAQLAGGDLFESAYGDGAGGVYVVCSRPPTADDLATLNTAAAAAIAGYAPPRIISGPIQPAAGLLYDVGATGARWDTAWVNDVNTLSDARTKVEVQELEGESSRQFIDRLRPVSYRRWNGSRRHYGFLAQEVATALGASAASFAVWCSDPVADAAAAGLPPGLTDVQSLRYEELIAPLVAAVQELSLEVDRLKDQLSGQEDRLNDLEAK